MLPLCSALILTVSLLCSAAVQTAGASEFGPFQGKIVDAVTKEPIEGVVVLFEWWQIHPFRGGSSFYDAQETVTDKNGEFYIPGIWSLNPLVWMRTTANVTLYKGGYGSLWKFGNYLFKLPWISLENEGGAPKGTFIWKIEDEGPVFLLKKLTLEERKQQRLATPGGEVPREKKPLLIQEMNKERRYWGLEEWR